MSWFKSKPTPKRDVVMRPSKHWTHGGDKLGVLSPNCEACRPMLIENISRCADVGWSREFMRTVLADVDAA